MEESSIVGLIGVALGWLLGQGSELARRYLDQRRLRQAAWTEVDDVSRWLENMDAHIRFDVQQITLGVVPDSVPTEVTNYVFATHAPTILTSMSHERRTLLLEVHAQIANLNEQLVELRQHLANKNLDAYLTKLKVVFHIAREIRFMILNFHTNNLPMSSMHAPEALLKYQYENEMAFEKLQQEAKEKGIDKVRQEFYGLK